MTKADAAELVATLTAAFPNNRVDNRTMWVYQNMLADLDREAAHKAVARLICTRKFMPTVAEIRAAAVECERGARRLGGEAWGDVGMAVRKFGRNREPEFDDPTVAECVRQLGWLSLCNSTNEVADRARFIELYDGLAVQQRADLVAGAANALPAPRSGRQLRDVPGLKAIGNGGRR